MQSNGALHLDMILFYFFFFNFTFHTLTIIVPHAESADEVVKKQVRILIDQETLSTIKWTISSCYNPKFFNDKMYFT